MMLFAWAALAERPRLAQVAGAALGIGGVALMLLGRGGTVHATGVLASVSAMTMSSFGYVLAKKWSGSVDVISLTAWQLVAGGLILTPAAVLIEGAPPTVDGRALLGFGYVTVVATALAFVAWFTGLRHLGAGTVGLVGLSNPVTGVLLGTVVAGEGLSRAAVRRPRPGLRRHPARPADDRPAPARSREAVGESGWDRGVAAAGIGNSDVMLAPPGTRVVTDWLLTAHERGNPDTSLDARHADGRAFTTGNEVTPLVHGRTYFEALCEAVSATRAGDLVLFTDWRGDPDEQVVEGVSVSGLLCRAAERGVAVKGLVWRSHLDVLRFSSEENRRLGAEIEAAGGECLLDMRVRPGGSHHQKLVVVRYRDHPERDVAFVGGIDLCHSRRDDRRHRGDPQGVDMAQDVRRPPAVARHPGRGARTRGRRRRGHLPGAVGGSRRRCRATRYALARSRLDGEELRGRPLPAAGRRPARVRRPGGAGPAHLPVPAVELPVRPRGERSIARAYGKALRRARSLVYLEDQYLWSAEVAGSSPRRCAASRSYA